jgi:2-desacetyl-2-hydroxyethyl bacteriochlorophyllide A dehydrogenase
MSERALYFTGPGEVTIRETTVEQPAPDELAVETTVSGISAGSELLVYRGDAPSQMVADDTIDALEDDLSFPLRYGYAAVGEVIDVGASLEESWLGESVFAFAPHSTHCTESPDNLIRLPEDVTPEAATLLPSVETATNLVLDGQPHIGERAVVFGAGMIGLCTTHLLSSFPLAELIVVDPIAERRAIAEKFGADVAVDPAEIETAVGGWEPSGADLVYELSGRPQTLDDAIDVAGYDSRVIVGSWYGTKRAPLELGGRFHRDRIDISSSQVSTINPELRGRWDKRRRLETAMDALRELTVEELISHQIPFSEAPKAYQLLEENPENALQVLLTYDTTH